MTSWLRTAFTYTFFSGSTLRFLVAAWTAVEVELVDSLFVVRLISEGGEGGFFGAGLQEDLRGGIQVLCAEVAVVNIVLPPSIKALLFDEGAMEVTGDQCLQPTMLRLGVLQYQFEM